MGNSSFEGPLIQGHIPDPWRNICTLTSTPDIQPGFLNVTAPPQDGNSYIQLLCRRDGTNEGLYQRLTDGAPQDSFIPGHSYYFEAWIAAYRHEGYNFNDPARLQLWLSNHADQPCQNNILAWQSPPIQHTDWQPYLIFFTLPPGQYYDVIQFESAHPDDVFVNGNVMLDNLSDTIFEGILPRLGPDTILCAGDSLLLSVPDSASLPLWQDGSVGYSYQVHKAGIYWAEITLHGIPFRDSIEIGIKPRPDFSLGADTVLCIGDQLTLKVKEAADTYLWQDFTTSDTLIVEAPGLYWAPSTLDGCSTTDTLHIAYRDCETILDMPNVFTPNDDGMNETLLPMLVKNVYQPQLYIYDRWGREVYQSGDLQAGWNGQHNGKAVPAGV
ncbi:MAG: gliding motility-associated C-terminal domain-containing protein, partial [Bacteroidetes bacterium]